MCASTIAFNVPIGLSMLDKGDHKYLALGTMSGFLSVPFGVFITSVIVMFTHPAIRSTFSSVGEPDHVVMLTLGMLLRNMIQMCIRDRVEIMPGGLTNKNFRAVTEDGAQIAIRLAGQGTANYINRPGEKHNASEIAGLGIAPEIYYYDPGTGSQIVEYIDAPTIDVYKRQVEACAWKILDEAGQVGIMLGADCTVPADIDDNRLEWVRQAAIRYAGR